MRYIRASCRHASAVVTTDSADFANPAENWFWACIIASATFSVSQERFGAVGGGAGVLAALPADGGAPAALPADEGALAPPTGASVEVDDVRPPHFGATAATAANTAGVLVAPTWPSSRLIPAQSFFATSACAFRRLSSTALVSAVRAASLAAAKYTESDAMVLSCFCASRRFPASIASLTLSAASSLAVSFTAF